MRPSWAVAVKQTPATAQDRTRKRIRATDRTLEMLGDSSDTCTYNSTVQNTEENAPVFRCFEQEMRLRPRTSSNRPILVVNILELVSSAFFWLPSAGSLCARARHILGLLSGHHPIDEIQANILIRNGKGAACNNDKLSPIEHYATYSNFESMIVLVLQA